jgi:hypothetical protein
MEGWKGGARRLKNGLPQGAGRENHRQRWRTQRGWFGMQRGASTWEKNGGQGDGGRTVGGARRRGGVRLTPCTTPASRNFAPQGAGRAAALACTRARRWMEGEKRALGRAAGRQRPGRRAHAIISRSCCTISRHSLFSSLLMPRNSRASVTKPSRRCAQPRAAACQDWAVHNVGQHSVPARRCTAGAARSPKYIKPSVQPSGVPQRSHSRRLLAWD